MPDVFRWLPFLEAQLIASHLRLSVINPETLSFSLGHKSSFALYSSRTSNCEAPPQDDLSFFVAQSEFIQMNQQIQAFSSGLSNLSDCGCNSF